MSLTTTLEADFDAIVKDFKTTVRIAGTDYIGTMSETTLQDNLVEGGDFNEIDAIITLKTHDFITRPKTGDIVRVVDSFEEHLEHKNYRVVSVEYPDGIVLRITVKQEGRGDA